MTENQAPTLEGARVWRAAPEPLLTIGAGGERALAGDTLYEFTDIAGGQLLADGRVVVAVMGASTLRFYDSTGRFERSAGRKGAGPGEFRQILALYRMRGDTLAVNDHYLELDWFGPDGRSIRRGRASRDEFAQLQTVSLLEDGTYFGIEMSHREPSGRFTRRMLTLLRVDVTRGTVDTVATLPGILESSRAPGFEPQPVIFTPTHHFAALDDSLITANSATYELFVRSRDGPIGRTIRRAWTGTAVDERLKEEYKEYHLTRPGAPLSARWRRQQERWFSLDPYADTYPAFQRILTSHEGDIWVQRYEPRSVFRRNWSLAAQWSDESSTWDVFARSGRWQTTVELPARYTLLDVRGDRLLGLTVNDDEEEGVQVLRLLRP